MNKFKKTALVIISAIGISCLAAAAACSKKPVYYSLTFEGTGIDYVLQDKLADFESGGTVKSGLEVKFGVSLGANAVGTPTVYLNGEPLVPDSDGYYTFTIKEDSLVTVSGLSVLHTVTLDKMQSVTDSDGNTTSSAARITYLGEDGTELGDSCAVADGGSLKFKLGVSPYYVRTKEDGTPAYTVSCNTEELVPDANGYYTADGIDGDVTISISGLEQEAAFTERGDGSGTLSDPYRIRKPIDLFYVAALVNSDFYYVSFYNAYYKVENDIDMEGEQLYVIGDYSHSGAIFSGEFDGNGKTIKNFYITDEVIDQSTFEDAYIPYVGLFGAAVATTEKPVVIKNVVLKDYEVTVHPAQSSNFSYAGSVVGFGIGVHISGCDLSGTITAVGDDNQMIYLGGVAGVLQSAYSAEAGSLSFDSYAVSSAVDTVIDGTGSPRSAGGVVGYLVSADTSVIAYVANCSSYGGVSGAMHSGGIVGTMGRYTSVSNCYASGEIIANNGVSNPLIAEEYRVAYAGGIAGYAENDTVIYACYAANSGLLYAESVSSNGLKSTGDYVGKSAPDGTDAVDGFATVTFNCKKATDGSDKSLFTGELGWLEEEWSFDGAPLAKRNDSVRTLTITIMADSSPAESGEKSLTCGLAPLAGWYGDALPEFISSEGGGRSWGYYFDEALTRKAPYSFVPAAANTVLYAGYSDYSSVAGKYYLSSDAYSGKAYIELTADGGALFRNGGMHYEGTYTYDGKNDIVWLPVSCFGALLYTTEELDGGYCAIKGTKTNDGFYFYGTISLVDTENSTSDSTSYVTKEVALNGVAALLNFTYGEYAGTSGKTYTFNEDGSGVYVNGASKQAFTFTVESGKAVMTFVNSAGHMEATLDENGKVTAVEGDTVTLKDAFAGVWQRTANSAIKFDFNGLGQVTCTGVAGGTVSYTVDGGTATFTAGSVSYSASFDDGILDDGILKINGEKYYLADGYTGTWYTSDSSERIELTLGGVGKDGYGDAVISYAGTKVAAVDGQYSVSDGVLLVYSGDMPYGELTLSSGGTSASGAFYSLRYESYMSGVRFDIYDNFKGNWVSNSDFGSVTFNGKSSTGGGEATITKANGATAVGTYTLTDSSSGTLTVGGDEYGITYDEASGLVTVSDTASVTLARTDGWQNVVLYDGETEYSFDGKGYIGGTVTVSSGGTLSYTVSASGAITIGGTALTATDGGFNYGQSTLSFKSGYAGEWVMSGAQKKLTIGEVNGNLTASLTISALDGGNPQSMTAIYDTVKGTLTVTAKSGAVKTVITLTLLGSDELSYEYTDGTTEEYKVCIKSSNVDAWQGSYVLGSSAWSFDGLGSSVYGSGTATLTVGGVSAQYRYKLNVLGTPYIKYNGGVIFIPASDGADGFAKDGQTTKYVTVVPDAYYTLSVTLTGGSDTFVFDGAGGLYKKEESGYVKAYDYEINADGTFKLTDSNGNEYVGTVTASGKINYLTIETE